jgi:hypothetical protein
LVAGWPQLEEGSLGCGIDLLREVVTGLSVTGKTHGIILAQKMNIDLPLLVITI